MSNNAPINWETHRGIICGRWGSEVHTGTVTNGTFRSLSINFMCWNPPDEYLPVPPLKYRIEYGPPPIPEDGAVEGPLWFCCVQYKRYPQIDVVCAVDANGFYRWYNGVEFLDEHGYEILWHLVPEEASR